LTFERSVCVGLNVTTTTKKVVNFVGEEKCTPREQLHAHAQRKRMRKGPPPYVAMG